MRSVVTWSIQTRSAAWGVSIKGGGLEREDMLRTTVDGDGVAAPDVFRVDVGEANVLDDNVLCVAYDADTFALDYAFVALADQTLVRANGHAEHTGFVVGDLADLGGFGLVVVAPFVLVNSALACRASSPRSTSRVSDSALGALEVKGLGENNDAGRRVTEVADELGSGTWVHWRSIASAGYT